MEMGFNIDTPEFENGQWIGREHTCEAGDQPPTLEWSHVPDGARSFALIMDDPDAPSGTFTHWLLWNIPAETRAIGGEADSIGVSGRNDFHQVGYRGPCPPPNHGAHRYFFHLYALDVDALDLPQGAGREALEEAMRGHVVAETDIMGRFQR